MDSLCLKYFVAAASTLNFSKVAEEFYISQPAVSYQITVLEKELGVELFLRKGKQLSLTEEGIRFLPRAIDILDRTENAILEMKRYKQGMEGVISIAVANTCNKILRRCIKEFTPENCNITLDIRVAIGSEQIEILENGDYDIFIGAEGIMQPYKGRMEYIRVAEDTLCLALPKNIKEPEDMNDLSSLNDVPYIGLSRESSQMITDDVKAVMQKLNYSPTLVHRYNRSEAVLYSVDAGVGAAILPYSLTEVFASDNIKYIPLDHDLAGTPCVIAWQKNESAKAAGRFIEMVRRLYGKAE